jgi:hypothetical protein
MGAKLVKYSFEVPFPEIEADLDSFVSAVFSCLESEFLVLPKGEGFVNYPVFEKGYESLKQATSRFKNIQVEPVMDVVFQTPMSLIVLRTHAWFHPAGMGLHCNPTNRG